MDISEAVRQMKKKPAFSSNVGMVLIHNGTVRGRSRTDGKKVTSLEVRPNQEKIEDIRQDFLKKTGIFDINIEAREGRFQPGEDLLFIIVAGDIREHVKPTLSDLLEKIKTEAIEKKEILEE
ncbi:MAG: molybdenum cofactor biosynthesis protein MoaE [Desulfobulbaceae bacterium]|nr:molybdenum cofactor biosynthesis protein MoaE [Desulfobulbaceae bacterium]